MGKKSSIFTPGLTIYPPGDTLGFMKTPMLPPVMLLPILMILLVSSCTSDQEVLLKADGSGRSRIEIELHPFFVHYLRDLTAGLGDPLENEADFRIFDEYRIAASFNRIDGLLLEDFRRLKPGHIVISASFSNPAGVLPLPADPAAPPVLDLKDHGEGSHTLFLNLTTRNIDSFYGLLGVEEQQNMLTFGPQKDPLSEDEYVDMMVYAMGTYADPKELDRILRRQRVDIRFEVEGTVTAVEGMELREGAAVVSLPFLKPATLAEPIRLSLTWRE